MTPIRLEGDDEDEEDAGDDVNEDDNEDDDEESTPVPRSKRPNAAACVLLRSFFWELQSKTYPNLLETASSRDTNNKRKRMMGHQSLPTQFWIQNPKERKLQKWMDCWTTTSENAYSKLVIIEGVRI